jgi:hypothetical protein
MGGATDVIYVQHDTLVHIALGGAHVVHAKGLPVPLQAVLPRNTGVVSPPQEVCLVILGLGCKEMGLWVCNLQVPAVPVLGRLVTSTARRLSGRGKLTRSTSVPQSSP